jgi:probable addiction module antidote protein
MRKKSRSYKIGLDERLKDPRHAASYVDAALENDSIEGFLIALKDVVDANQGMAGLAELTSLNRENLYRALSESGNPKLDTLTAILSAIGMRLRIELVESNSEVDSTNDTVDSDNTPIPLHS